MIRNLFIAVAAMAALGYAASFADEKKAEPKPLEGKIVCTKCKLKETADCGNALQVKDGDKTVTYYLQDAGKDADYHVCSGEKAAKVTGKVVEKDKKKTIESPKVEIVK